MNIWEQNWTTLRKGYKNSKFELWARVSQSGRVDCITLHTQTWVAKQQVSEGWEGGATGAWAWASFTGVGWKSACLDFYIIKLRQLARSKRLALPPCHASCPYIRIATSGLHRFKNTVWLGLVACRFGSLQFQFVSDRIGSFSDRGPRTTGHGLRTPDFGLRDFAGQLWR